MGVCIKASVEGFTVEKDGICYLCIDTLSCLAFPFFALISITSYNGIYISVLYFLSHMSFHSSAHSLSQPFIYRVLEDRIYAGTHALLLAFLLAFTFASLTPPPPLRVALQVAHMIDSAKFIPYITLDSYQLLFFGHMHIDV